MFSVETVLSQAKQYDKAFQGSLPGYQTLRGSAISAYDSTIDAAQGVLVLVDQKWEQTGGQALKKSRSTLKTLREVAEKKTDDILSEVESRIEVAKSSSEEGVVVKNPKTRIIAIIYRLNEMLVIRVEGVKRYTLDMVQKGRKMTLNYCLPIYITLKATTLVTREMLMEILESRIQNMKVSYESSKDTVTMLIQGKFQEDQIKEKLSEGMKSFKQLTVNVVHKGLEIKVDGKSLRENYDEFALKFLEIVRNMRVKGTENIASMKDRSLAMYNEVINRIKEKEIQIRLEYRELKSVTE